MADNHRVKEQLKEITERLEQGIQEVFESEKYKEYLDTMGKFYNYSFNNTMLIAMQKPDATLIAGYQAWQKKFERHVKHGEKGIRIIAPAPINKKEELEKLDPVTLEPMLDERGKPIIEEVEVRVPSFKVISVFDVSQTEGKELPDIVADELTGEVENYEVFMQVLTETAPVPIGYEEISDGAKGYYHLEEKRIALQKGMSEIQNIKTAIHEIAHAILHDADLNKSEYGEQKDRKTKEVEAESIAYAVSQHYGIDTSDYSFGYIAGWSSDKELKKLKSSLETIRKTSATLISTIDTKVAELEQHRNNITIILADEEEHTYTYPFDVVSVDIEEMGGDRTAVFKATNVNLDAAVMEFHNSFHGTELEKVIAESYGIEWVESIDYEDGSITTPELLQKGQTKEEKLLSGKEDSVGIYQLKKGEELHYHRFEGLERLQMQGLSVKKENYDLIYTAPLEEGQTLDDIFEWFNLFRPEDFTGHSLSVSDVVLLHKEGVNTAQYVDNTGFREIPYFLGQEIDSKIMEAKQLAFQIDDCYLSIQTMNTGYDFTFYDEDYREWDGGVYDNTDVTPTEAVIDILTSKGLVMEDCRMISYDELRENVEQVEQGELKKNNELDLIREPALTEEQAEVLWKIANESGMDCWFSIGEGNSYIYDLEENQYLALSEGIQLLSEGMTKYEDYNLSAEEITLFEELLSERDIEKEQHKNSFKPDMKEPGTVFKGEVSIGEQAQTLTFYVAECMEFTTLGEYSENLALEEAVRLYEAIPAERMSGIKGIGFRLHKAGEEADMDSTMAILNGNTIDVDMINHVSEFRDNQLVQEAVKAVIRCFPKAEVWDMKTKSRAWKPLAKIEELKEANYNQSDEILNNQNSKDKDQNESSLSITERLKRNREMIACKNLIGKEKKTERGIE